MKYKVLTHFAVYFRGEFTWEVTIEEYGHKAREIFESVFNCEYSTWEEYLPC